MSPEQEWEYEQKLDHLSYRLQELILEMFINVVQSNRDNYSFIMIPVHLI
jgi:hypothetical protein